MLWLRVTVWTQAYYTRSMFKVCKIESGVNLATVGGLSNLGGLHSIESFLFIWETNCQVWGSNHESKSGVHEKMFWTPTSLDKTLINKTHPKDFFYFILIFFKKIFFKTELVPLKTTTSRPINNLSKLLKLSNSHSSMQFTVSFFLPQFKELHNLQMWTL